MAHNNTDRSAAGTQGFLSSGGEMAARIAAFDWTASLGPIAAWPQSLKTVTETLLRSPVPIVLLWGPDGVMICAPAPSTTPSGCGLAPLPALPAV